MIKKLILMKFLEWVEENGEDCNDVIHSIESYLIEEEGPSFKINEESSKKILLHLLCKWSSYMDTTLGEKLFKEIDATDMFKAQVFLPEMIIPLESLFDSENNDWIVNPCSIRRINVFEILEQSHCLNRSKSKFLGINLEDITWSKEIPSLIERIK